MQVEKRQSFNDEPLTTCESCQGRLQRVIQPSVVIYKGSGFYCTDNKSSSGGNGRSSSRDKTEDSTSSAGDGTGSSASNNGETAKAGAGKD